MSLAFQMYFIAKKIFKQYRYTIFTHSTTKNPKDLEIDNVFLILSYNDEHIKQLLYLLGAIIVPCSVEA